MLIRVVIVLLGVAHALGAIVAALALLIRHSLNAGDFPEYLFWSFAIPSWLIFGFTLSWTGWKFASERRRVGRMAQCLAVWCTIVVASYMAWLMSMAPDFDRMPTLIAGGMITILYLAVNAAAIIGIQSQVCRTKRSTQVADRPQI